MICIYQIRNLINGKVYVGQTVNESRRKANHLFLLRMNKHHSIKLKNAYNKYGEKNFIFEILEECSKEELNDRELYYIQKKDSYNNGYNCNEGGQFRTDRSGKNNTMYGVKGKNHPRFKDFILQLTLDGNIVGRFETLNDAATAVNGDFSTIRKCLIHQRKNIKVLNGFMKKNF